MNKQRTTVSMLGTAAIFCGMLASSASAIAQSDSETSQQSEGRRRSCSNRTLYGNYGTTIEGFVVGVNLSIRGVAMAHFDGKGNLTQVDHVVTNGMPPALEWTPGTGTYVVNPDCTGRAVIHTASSERGVINLHFVVVKQGKEIRQVVDENAVTAIGVRLE